MNHIKSFLTLIPVGLALTGCGEWKKNPVPESNGVTLADYRKYAKEQSTQGPEKPRVITNTVIVEKPQVIVKEESSIDDKFIVITPDSQMTFNEGQAASFKVRARVLVPGVQVKLTAQGLPDGATLKASQAEKDLYVLSWTPSLYTVPSNASMKTYNVKLVAEVVVADDAKNAAQLKGLVRSKEINLFLFRNQELPSGLKVENLPGELVEGVLTPFSVTVAVPGIDGSASVKPRLVISYDGVSYTAGNNFLELDGSRYVVADLNQKDPEYLGDSKWKFSLLFDTKNISVQPQLAKDGTILKNSDGTRVRLSFKAFSPIGLATPETLQQIKIKYTKTITAPRFDVSGLAQQSLEVSRGQAVSLKFTVATPDSAAAVAVETKEAKLAGSPSVTCQASASGANKQECTLSWNVPCDAALDQVAGQIEMTATSTVNSRSSETTAYALKVVNASTEQNLCNTGATAPSTEQNPAEQNVEKK